MWQTEMDFYPCLIGIGEGGVFMIGHIYCICVRSLFQTAFRFNDISEATMYTYTVLEEVTSPGNWTGSNGTITWVLIFLVEKEHMGSLQGTRKKQQRKNTHLHGFPFWNYLSP